MPEGDTLTFSGLSPIDRERSTVDDRRMKVGWTSIAVLSGVAVLAAACGTAAPGAGTPFCADAAKLSTRILSGERGNPELSWFKANETSIDDLAIDSPRAVTRDVHTLVTGVHRAIATSTPELLNTAAMNEATSKIKTYCGIRQ